VFVADVFFIFFNFSRPKEEKNMYLFQKKTNCKIRLCFCNQKPNWTRNAKREIPCYRKGSLFLRVQLSRFSYLTAEKFVRIYITQLFFASKSKNVKINQKKRAIIIKGVKYQELKFTFERYNIVQKFEEM
jgi:hypothetical protein